MNAQAPPDLIPSGYLIGSLDRGLAALSQFIAQPEMSFTDFRQACGLDKASAKRILFTLEHNGLVKFNPSRKTYRLGLRLFELGTVAGENLVLLKVARDYMESVVNQINETVILAQRIGNQQVYLHKIEGVGTVHLTTLIGHRRPLHYGLGKTILAYLCDDDMADCLPDQLPPYTPHTLSERETFLRDVKATRERGYAIDEEEFVEGVIGIGFPIFVNQRDIFGLVGVVGPISRMTCEKRELVVHLLRKVSQTISLRLDEYLNDN